MRRSTLNDHDAAKRQPTVCVIDIDGFDGRAGQGLGQQIVYSSDGTNLGEVAAFARDSSGNITEMHADVGGFLGMGETRVRLMPSDFRLAEIIMITLTIMAE